MAITKLSPEQIEGRSRRALNLALAEALGYEIQGSWGIAALVLENRRQVEKDFFNWEDIMPIALEHGLLIRLQPDLKGQYVCMAPKFEHEVLDKCPLHAIVLCLIEKLTR